VFANDDRAHLLIKRAHMRVSVKDQGSGSHRPGQIDRMLPEEFPDALANEGRFDKEMVELDLRPLATVKCEMPAMVLSTSAQ
jgi:hypothetical protein